MVRKITFEYELHNIIFSDVYECDDWYVDSLAIDDELRLVWTTNFADELRNRQQRRQQEAARRQQELQDQQAELRASLVARLEASHDPPSENTDHVSSENDGEEDDNETND